MKKFSYLISLLIVMFFILTVNSYADNSTHKHSMSVVNKTDKKSLWTCSMHPQIKLSKPGKCPICGMDLIPVEKEESSGFAVSLKLSKNAEKLASIQTTKVIKKPVTKKIRLVGLIDFDETRLTHITAWVPGRIDRMFVDFTGITVNEGDHMFELYSPELISAQEELIQANRSIKKLRNSSSTLVANSTKRALKAVEEKLLLLGLTKDQVSGIKNEEEVKDKITIYAPIGGVVVERNATEGMYVKEGSRVYSIADLGNLWIYLDAYESDLPWIRYGQKVTFNTKAIPGIDFEGIVSFISPIVDSKTRTTKIRVNVDNSAGILKPGLFVNGVIKANVYSQGKVFEDYLKGKYVCPMHPEIIEDESGKCPICEMNLVKAEKLGTFKSVSNKDLPLVIPVTAVLNTGKRSIVYIKNNGKYELREVVLGPKTDDFYIIESGLKEGELVVTNGAFKIDADLQIKGEKSMMNPEGFHQTTNHNHSKNTKEKVPVNKLNKHKHIEKKILPDNLKNIIDTYLNLSEFLASDNLSDSKKELLKLEGLAKKQEIVNFPNSIFKNNSTIKDLRSNFGKITSLILPNLNKYKLNAYKAYCPMAFKGKGGFWLQKNNKIRNPYFGSRMLACGVIKGEL